jgi:hypothetical protein
VSLTTAQIAKRVSPSVVVIQGKTEFGDVLGSGFIVSKDGNIVTNLHVIRDMKTASVQLADGKVFDSLSVLAVDERHDLAIVKVADFNLTVLPLGNSDTLTVGEQVVVVGSPLGLEATVTAGILSATRSDGEGSKLLQTDAAVNHGNSGGPLVTNNGLAVGVVSSILRSDSAQGLNFAIPINYVRGLMDNLHEPVTLEEMQRHLTVKTRPTPSKPLPTTPVPQGPLSPTYPLLDVGHPSLRETLQFLETTMPLGAVKFVVLSDGFMHSETFAIDARLFSTFPVSDTPRNCHAQFYNIRTTTRPNLPPVYTTNVYEIQLGVITGSTIQQWETGVVGATFVSGDKLAYRLVVSTKYKEIGHGYYSCSPCVAGQLSITSDNTDRMTLIFSTEALAHRAEAALLHAADLCRIKEPF